MLFILRTQEGLHSLSSAHHPFSVWSECKIITRIELKCSQFFFQIFRIERSGWSLGQENYEVCVDVALVRKTLVQRFIAKFFARWWKENWKFGFDILSSWILKCFLLTTATTWPSERTQYLNIYYIWLKCQINCFELNKLWKFRFRQHCKLATLYWLSS